MDSTQPGGLLVVYTTGFHRPIGDSCKGVRLEGGVALNSEIPRSTRALLNLLERSSPGPSLDIGSYQGAVALEVGCSFVSADLLACAAARKSGATMVLHSDMLPSGPFSTVLFDAREYDYGLAAETVAQAAARLTPGGVLITTARPTDVAAVFGLVEEAGEAVVARNPAPGSYRPEWPAYSFEFGDRTWSLRTAPGVFSPRALDEGTAQMLSLIQTQPGARFLDLGCGAGVVSLIASEAWQCQVCAIDVNARALRLTAQNAPRAEVLASNGFEQLGGRQFDIIASNPPYHTDFAVGKAFIEGAYRHLAVGGTLYLVVKRTDWYVEKTRSTFGGCRLVEQGGYTVIIAERREPKAPRPVPAGDTTKKHAKRMASAAKKHHGPR